MKIGIETTTAIKRLGGISEYSYNLLRALAQIDHKNQYVLLNFSFFRQNLRTLPKLPKNFEVKNINLPNRLMNFLWRTLSWPGLNNYLPDCDLIFKPHFLGAPVMNKPLILTVYDLSFYHHPEWFNSVDQRQMMEKFRENLVKAKIILAISQYTKDDLVLNFQVDPRKIVVTPLAVDDVFKKKISPSRQKAILSKYNINKPYILYLGTLEPRKNIIRLIKAFSQITSRYPDLRLVLAGRYGWLYDDILRASEQMGDKIILTGPVADKDRPGLYQGSEMFVYPSLFEGFGLPPLEAMASGTPVITSDNSSLTEIASRAALLVNPHNISEIAAAMTKILKNPRLKQQLIKNGKTRVKQFSWEKCARQTLKSFAKAGKR